MAFNVALMPVKAVSGVWDEALGAPNVGTASIVAEAIRYAADHGAKVINLSLGFEGEVTPVRDAIKYAIDKGAFVAAAAGNSGERAAREFFPGRTMRRISTGWWRCGAWICNFNRAPTTPTATLTSRSPRRAATSTRTSTTMATGWRSSGDARPRSRRPRHLQSSSITSSSRAPRMATPHVSGLAALLMTQGVTDPKAVERDHRALRDRHRLSRPRQRHRLRRHQPARPSTASAWPNRGAHETPHHLRARRLCAACSSGAAGFAQEPVATVPAGELQSATTTIVKTNRDRVMVWRRNPSQVLTTLPAGVEMEAIARDGAVVQVRVPEKYARRRRRRRASSTRGTWTSSPAPNRPSCRR